MTCPILEIGWMQTKVGDKGVSSDCLKEECAWWSKDEPECIIQTIDYRLGDIAHYLSEIAKELTLVRRK